MDNSPTYSGTAILIPGYSVEDIPTDLNESQATGLLNAIGFSWHPFLLAASSGIPTFRYADIHDLMDAGQILLVPECSEEWLGHDWEEQLEAGNCHVLSGQAERSDWRAAVVAQFSQGQTLSVHVEREFLALGLAWFLVVSLSRRMHYFIDPDEVRLATAAQEAASAAISGDHEVLEQQLTVCFECLLETREQLFPVETHLIDLCLPGELADLDTLAELLESEARFNLLASPSEVHDRLNHSDRFAAALQDATTQGRCCLVSGGWHELRHTLGTMSGAFGDLFRTAGHHGQLRVWGQKRFGLFHSLPQLLALFDCEFALHVALDDGLYPEREAGHFNWEGPGGASVGSASRLPVAVDSAASLLRFPERLAETMQQDTQAVLMMARLPELSTPWLDDLRIVHQRVPLIGPFVTLADFANAVDSPGDQMTYPAGEYLPPHLVQSSVLKTEAPITGPADLYQTRHRLDQATALDTIKSQVTGFSETPADDSVPESERWNVILESRLQDFEAERLNGINTDLTTQENSLADIQRGLEEQTQSTLSKVEKALETGSTPGLLVVNSAPFARDATVPWPHTTCAPASSDALHASWRQKDQSFVRCRLPPGGFVLLSSTAETNTADADSGGLPLADDGLLRNQFFEVLLSEQNGGITDVRFHGQRANRVSQHVAWRYETSRTISATEERDEFITSYADTVCRSMCVIEASAWRGVVESRCELRDLPSGDLLGEFRQVTSVDRTSPRITIDIFPSAETHATGNPWMTYLACRFAWDNEAAAITRSILGQACGFHGERFESPDYVEIADEDHRLLIVPHGRPYHRRSGRRMLDSLLLVENQPVPASGFRFTLEFDQAWPMRTVTDLMQPVVSRSVSVEQSTAAWLTGITAKNVQVTRIHCSGDTMDLLLYETEGQSADCRLRTACTPSTAEERNGIDRQVRTLQNDDAGVPLSFSPFEVKRVRLTF